MKRKFKLDSTVSACEISLDDIVNRKQTLSVDVELSKFPSVERDLTLKVTADTPFGRIDIAIHSALDQEALIYSVMPVSIYQPDSESKNLSFHLKFASLDHTLNAEEITAIMDKITVATTQLGAQIV